MLTALRMLVLMDSGRSQVITKVPLSSYANLQYSEGLTRQFDPACS